MDERRKLETEINDVISKINSVKEKIYFLYKSTELNKEEAKKLLVPYGRLRKSIQNPKNLTAAFVLRNCAEICIEDEFITIMLPFPNEEKYGFRFEKREATDLYNLTKCSLPNSLNAGNEIKKARALTLIGVAEYVKTIKRNIYAYYMRKIQFEELETIVKSGLYFAYDFSPCYTYLRIHCYYASKENVKHSNCVIVLRYNELDILPSQIEISGTVNDNLRRKCSVFQKEVLAIAYSKLTEEADLWLHLIHR